MTKSDPHFREYRSDIEYNYVEGIYPFKDILETRIVENDTTITKTSRTSQIGGAVLGGLLVGNVGAVIGGLSGSKTSENMVDKLELIIIVNSFNNPVIKIPFLNEITPVDRNDQYYISALNDIQSMNPYNNSSYF